MLKIIERRFEEFCGKAKEILDKVSKHFGGKWLCDIYDEYGVDYE